MNKLFTFGTLVVLGLLALCGYWYLNPHHAPDFIRGSFPSLELRTPRSPMNGFRGPDFGPR